MSGKTSDADSGAGGKTNSETSNEGKSYIGNFLVIFHSLLFNSVVIIVKILFMGSFFFECLFL